MSHSQEISVVICVKNEERRIEACLKSVAADHPSEIIVVDGNSSDRTVEIARIYTESVIVTQNSNMVRDRQIGIDATKHEFVAMIDADHRLREGDLRSLQEDLELSDFDVVQSHLRSYSKGSFWNQAEDEIWQLNHNIPGPRSMIGGAPAMYRKQVFQKVRFDPEITETTEDTDFCYRFSKIPGLRMGIGKTVIAQEHFSGLRDYMRKFRWYGKGDGEFCRKHPGRMPSMIFHLLVRYPFFYPLKAVMGRKFKAPALMVLQGLGRFCGLARYAFASHKDSQ
jgi:glycosyltransferase involved in cell wall biosynthesis